MANISFSKNLVTRHLFPKKITTSQPPTKNQSKVAQSKSYPPPMNRPALSSFWMSFCSRPQSRKLNLPRHRRKIKEGSARISRNWHRLSSIFKNPLYTEALWGPCVKISHLTLPKIFDFRMRWGYFQTLNLTWTPLTHQATPATRAKVVCIASFRDIMHHLS